jgi:hypothetical protein
VVITGLVKVILGYPQGSRVPSYSNTEVWTTVHTGIAIVCSNLPILNPLLIRILKSSFVAKMTTFWPNRGGHRQSYSVVDASGSGHYDPDFSGRTARSNAAARSMSDIHRLPKIVQTSESEQIMPRRRSQDAQLRENNLDWGGERELLPFIQTPSSETSLTAQVADFPEHGNNRIESQ